MWKIFQKEALGILRDTSRIDSFKIPDHVVPSEFTEMKVTLEMNSAGTKKVISGRGLLWLVEPRQ